MIDIYIDKVELQNCRGHSEMEMDFPVNNFTVIQGKNGSGKSTIPKSISMALFGDDGSPPGEKLTVTEMVNRKTGKDLSIKVYFRSIESDVVDHYRVELYYNHHQYQNQFFLFKNDIPISGKTKADTYKMIEEILYPKDIYHNVIYFSQQVKNFFTSLTNSQQKELFDTILQTKIYNLYYSNAHEQEGLLKKSLSEVDSDIEKLNHEYSLRDEEISRLKKSRDEFVKQNAELLSELKLKKINFENQIQILSDSIKDSDYSENEYDSLKKEIVIVEQKISQIEQKINDQIEKLETDKNSEWKTIQLNLDREKQSEHEKIRSEIDEKVSNLHNEKSKIFNLITEIQKKYDSTELLKDKSDFEKEKQKEIRQVYSMISDLDSEFSIIDIESERDNRLSIIDTNIQDLKTKAAQLKEKAVSIKSSIDEKNINIKKDRDSISGEVPICTKCLRPFDNEKDLQIIKNDILKSESDIKDLETKYKSFEDEMSSLRSEFEEASKVKEKTKLDYETRIKDVLEKKNQRISELENKQSLLQCEIDEYSKEIDSRIEILQEKSKSESLEYENRKQEIDSEINELQNEKRDRLQQMTTSYEKELLIQEQEHNKKYVQIRSDITDKFSKEIEKLQFKLDSYNEKMNKIESSKQSFSDLQMKLNTNKIELNYVMNRIQEVSSQTYDESLIDSAEKEKTKTKEKIDSQCENKTSIERELEIIKFWKIAFSDSGIKSMLIDMAIPHMNESVSKSLDKMAPGIFTVSFDTLKETKAGDIRDKFSVNVLHNIKGTDSHKLLSGGEKRIVDLACMDALRSLVERLYGKRIHNIFYDEVLDSLDDDNRQIFCQNLKLISEDKNVTLITHSAAEHMEPDRIFKF